MSKRRVYLFQPTFMTGSDVYLPYAIGALASYAWKFDSVRDNYELAGAFFLREPVDDVFDRVRDPDVAAFSCYMWNYEYNKTLASRIKRKYPECFIIFGGQQVAPGEGVLEECPFVDAIIHNEGEIPFRELLECLAAGGDLVEVGSLSVRTPHGIVTTPPSKNRDFDFPSPYQSGFFDDIIKRYPDLNFVPLVETNRGCPNKCTYCSWGSMKAGVRLFPMSRVMFDIEWCSSHGLKYLVISDANFGIIPRDEEITDRIVELKKNTGCPEKFQVSYTKDSNDRVFRITEKLNANKMDKGVTLSFQTMSPLVQKNIGRENIDLESYKALLKRYSDAGIPTYTELILGLPGETVESLTDGIEELLEMGQHVAFFVHMCEWLPCAEMGNREYMERFGLKYSTIPINRAHTAKGSGDDIPEYSRIITASSSMSSDDWIQMNLISYCVICFHHLGLLQCFALYLYREKGIRYVDFYSDLLKYLLEKDNGAAPVFRLIRERLAGIVNGEASAICFDDRFGDVAWTFEEYAYLTVVAEKDEFYKAVGPFLQKYVGNDGICDEILRYQSFIMKSVGDTRREFAGTYDWNKYFVALRSGKDAELEKRPVRYAVNDPSAVPSWDRYAVEVMWYGRKGGKNIYTNEIEYVG